MYIFFFMLPRIKTTQKTILGQLNTILLCCYCSKEHAVWIEQMCGLNTGRNKSSPVYVLASLPFPSLLLTTYTHKHVFHQIKANFSQNQMRILFMCAYYIKYFSAMLKMNLKKCSKTTVQCTKFTTIQFQFGYLKISNLSNTDRSVIPKLFYYPFIKCVVYMHTYHTHTTFPLFTRALH